MVKAITLLDLVSQLETSPSAGNGGVSYLDTQVPYSLDSK